MKEIYFLLNLRFQLEEPLHFREGIGSIGLPSTSENYYSGTKATVTGWGTLSSSGSLSNHLREVIVPLVPSSKCAQLYGRETITRRMICAGYIRSGGKDACQVIFLKNCNFFIFQK